MSNLKKLQAWIRDSGQDGIIIPSTDEFQNEYTPLAARRLEWVTEFTGSMGITVVLPDRAALFVDSRYTLQARAETRDIAIEAFHNFPRWLKTMVPDQSTLIVDARLHTTGQVEEIRNALENNQSQLVLLNHNPIDVLWLDRPAFLTNPVEDYPVCFAGLSREEKCQQLSQQMCANGLDYYLVTVPEEVAWLLNIRGKDIDISRVPLSRAVLSSNGQVDWFIQASQVPDSLREVLGDLVTLSEPESLPTYLDEVSPNKRVGINAEFCSYFYADRIEKAGTTIDSKLIEMAKAQKNDTELDCACEAQRIDALALINFMAWLENACSQREITELEAAAMVTECRAAFKQFKSVSFDPISASGANAALPHYKCSEESNALLSSANIYLLDSGGQYLGGTTDTTRTISIRPASEFEKRAYTLVLKGHIALACAQFPTGTTGAQLDSLARQFLWQQGLNYGHGTGHGVGSYLSVHEGPSGISPGAHAVPLLPGMILSNEPGYYHDGEFGIRIENLMTVVPSDHSEFLTFETLTYVPMDFTLTAVDLLTEHERAWLRDYHQRILTDYQKDLTEQVYQWLSDKIQPFIALSDT
jgi:Xaa-Pro aminopeptidase